MVAQKNIIKKVKIGVNIPSLENGMQLKDNLDVYFKEQIFPEMDTYFNSLQNNNSKIIRIENISIEIDVDINIDIEQKKIMTEIKSLIMNELEKKINKKDFNNDSDNLQILTSEQGEFEAFFYFLKRGSFPWWFEERSSFWDEVIEKIHSKKDISEKLKSLLSVVEIRKRLIFQFDDMQLFKIVSSVLNKIKKTDLQIEIPQIYRNQLWEIVLQYSTFKSKLEVSELLQNTPIKDVEKLLKILYDNFGVTIPIKNINLLKISDLKNDKKQNLKSEKSDDLQNSEKYDTIEKEGVLLKNAGLILLHPFLKMFFEKMEFLSEKGIKPEKIDEAIHVLHYLVTGREQSYEHELLIEKFICNVPFHQPVNRHIYLTKDQKIDCEVLLQAVLEHWTALKSSASELLQNEFLQREGKLTVTNEKQTLYIQRKTQDILLNKLPWNIHLIKIPWKKKILFVEW